jgi:hypothetical protein
VWFDTDLGGGFGFSTAPGGGVGAYRQMFIPFRKTVQLSPGDTFKLGLSVHQARENNLWAWRGWRVTPHGGEDLVVDQNSLAEIVIDPSTFPDTSASAMPALGPRGKALLALLGRLDGRHTVSNLAAQLAEECPDLFENPPSAQEFAATWIHRLAQAERGEEC